MINDAIFVPSLAGGSAFMGMYSAAGSRFFEKLISSLLYPYPGSKVFFNLFRI